MLGQHAPADIECQRKAAGKVTGVKKFENHEFAKDIGASAKQ